MDTLALFDSTDDKIKLTKNHNAVSLIEDKYGLNLHIRIQERILIIQGLIKDDILDH